MTIPKHIQAWSAEAKGSLLNQVELPVPELKGNEVLMKITASGICHSDIHLLNDDWGISSYPLVPGHEIIGQIVSKGNGVNHLKEGDFVGVGWQRSACLQCEDCIGGNENLCTDNTATCVGNVGGYADFHVADSNFCFSLPEELLQPQYAPLFCGGATVYTPLCEFVNQRGFRPARVGVIGLGGLGHMAVRMANAMGYEVTVFSGSPAKEQEAKQLGATHFINSRDAATIQAVGRKFDAILNTANGDLPWQSFLQTLRSDGTFVLLGATPNPISFHFFDLIGKRLRIAASPIAGRSRMRDMIEFCARHQLAPMHETFPMDKVNDALMKVKENQVRYRAVLIP